MISNPAKTIAFILKILNFKTFVEKSFQKATRSDKPLVPKYLYKSYEISEFILEGKTVATLQPKEAGTHTHILYFHGGAYVLEGSSMHWKIVETVIKKTNCRISYIDYPLAPESNYMDTFSMVKQSFNKLIKLYPNDKFIFMGDSAGGGLALAFAQKLANENTAVQPIKNILFSPWLDITMQNEDIKNQEFSDRVLPLRGLISAGKLYAGGENPTNYLLSPINAKLTNLPETIVFYGTYELFYPDCKLLAQRVKSIGNFKFFEYEGMQHDWVIYPIPEAKQALNTAIEFINKD